MDAYMATELSPIEPYVRTPLRDTTNQYQLTNNKKSETVDASPKCNRTFNYENDVEPELVSSQLSTPKKIQDSGDTESDTTAEYESAGESSPWGKEPNLSALADCLAGVHLSTPDKKNPSKLNHFPFSPISAEDETDDEVTAIISNNSQNSISGSLSLMEEKISPKSNSFSDGKNIPFVVINPSQLLAKVTDDNQEEKCSETGKSDSFRVITGSSDDILHSSVTRTGDHSTSLKIEGNDKENLISPTVEFQDAGPACSFHSEVMNSIGPQLLSGTLNSSLISNNSLIVEECRHSDSVERLDFNEAHLSYNDANEHGNDEVYISNNQEMETKCAFSHNSTNISENVLKFANEKHPVCLAEPTETLELTNSLNSLKSPVNPEESTTNFDRSDNRPDNISISEMCNLIETTFNSSLKENLNEICEKITSTNLKPLSLLGKDEVDTSRESVSSNIDNDSSSVTASVSVSEITKHDDDINIPEDLQGCIQNSEIPLQKSCLHYIDQINKQSSSIETSFSGNSVLTESDTVKDKSFSPDNSNILNSDNIEETSTKDDTSVQDLNNLNFPDKNVNVVIRERTEGASTIIQHSVMLDSNDHLFATSGNTSLLSVLAKPYQINDLNNSLTISQEIKTQDEIDVSHIDGSHIDNKEVRTLEENVEKTETQQVSNITGLALHSNSLSTTMNTSNLTTNIETYHHIQLSNPTDSSLDNSKLNEYCNESLSHLPIEMKIEEEIIQQSLPNTNIQETQNLSSALSSNDHSVPNTANYNQPASDKIFETSCSEDSVLNKSKIVEDNSLFQKDNEKKNEDISKVQEPFLNSNTEKYLSLSSTLNFDDHSVPSTVIDSKSPSIVDLKNSIETVPNCNSELNEGEIINGNLPRKKNCELNTKKVEETATIIENPNLNSDIKEILCIPTISESDGHLVPSTVNNLNSSTMGVIDLVNDLKSSTEISYNCNSPLNGGKIVDDRSLSQIELPLSEAMKIDEISTSNQNPFSNSNIERTQGFPPSLGSDNQSVPTVVNNHISPTKTETHQTQEEGSSIIHQSVEATRIMENYKQSPESGTGHSSELSATSSINNSEMKNLSLSCLNVVKCSENSTAILDESHVENPQEVVKIVSHVTVKPIDVKTSTLSISDSTCNDSTEIVKMNTVESKAHKTTGSSLNSNKNEFKQTMSDSELLNDIKKCMTMNVDECINENKSEISRAYGTEKSFEQCELVQSSMAAQLKKEKNCGTTTNKEIPNVIEGIENMKLVPLQASDNPESCKISVTSSMNHKFTTNKENICYSEPHEGIGVTIPCDSLKNIEDTENSYSNELSLASELTTGKTSAENTLIKQENLNLVIINPVSQEKNNSLGCVTPQPLATMTGVMTSENEGNTTSFNKTGDLSKLLADENVVKPKKNSTQGLDKIDKLNKSTPERKSYEDLLDKCLQQEKLLGFDDSFKEEANKIAQELGKSSDSNAISTEPESSGLLSPMVNISEAGAITADEDVNNDVFQEATNFDFEYLSKIRGKPGQRALIRESLFLKFDPLASSSSPGPQPVMDEKCIPQSDGSNDVLVTPTKNLLNAEEQQLVNISPSLILPASGSPRAKFRSSSASTTPTMRHEFLSKEISKLQDLMLKQECSYQEQIAACLDEIEYLKQKLADVEDQESLHELEEKLIHAETEKEELRRKLEIAEKEKEEMVLVAEEYDIAIRKIIKHSDEKQKEHDAVVEKLTFEKDQEVQHLRNMELAFNDIHQKYEKAKEVIQVFKENEEKLKSSLSENEKCIKQQQENYQKLKEHASQKIEEANNEIIEMKKAHKVEIARLGAINRKLEIQVKSLVESLEQEKKSVSELTKICDELISKKF